MTTIPERLSKMEQKVEDIKDDITEIKADIQDIKDMVGKLNDSYITRAEAKVAGVLIGIALTLVTIGINIMDKFRHQ